MSRKHKGQVKAAPPPSAKPRRTSHWPALIVFALPFALYVSTLNAGFIWDDHNLIEMNAKRNAESGLLAIWTSDFWQTGRQSSSSQYYRPLTTTTFALNYLIGGPNPRGYHFTNILIYALACVAAFYCFRKILDHGGMALLTALLFTALSAHSENVAWVSGRTDLLCALFMFAALLVYLHADETGRPAWWALSAVLFGLSLFAKEMSITMVAAVALHQLMFHGFKRSVTRTLPFAAVAAGFWIIHSQAAPHLPPENVYLDFSSHARSVIRNLGLAVYYSLAPGGFEYLVTATREQAARTFAAPAGLAFLKVSAPLLASFAALAASLVKRERWLAWALASGLIAIGPIAGIIPIGVIFAVRFLLIPSFFFILAAGLLLKRLGGPAVSAAGLSFPAAGLVLVPLIVIHFGVTVVQAAHWRDDATLMEYVLEKEPDSALGHFIMGNAKAGKGELKPAMEHYRRAIELRPEYPEAEYNLGILEERSGRAREAERLYRGAILHRPEFESARMALVNLLARTGRREEAMKVFEEGKSLGGRGK